MDEETPIYEIYVMDFPYKLDIHGFPDCGGREKVGFYYEADVALRAVKENWCDIQDHYAGAAEVLKVVPGLYPLNNRIGYYIWNKINKTFEEAEMPKFEGWDI